VFCAIRPGVGLGELRQRAISKSNGSVSPLVCLIRALLGRAAVGLRPVCTGVRTGDLLGMIGSAIHSAIGRLLDRSHWRAHDLNIIRDENQGPPIITGHCPPP
jgi:hypothetical protein